MATLTIVRLGIIVIKTLNGFVFCLARSIDGGLLKMCEVV